MHRLFNSNSIKFQGCQFIIGSSREGAYIGDGLLNTDCIALRDIWSGYSES